MFIIIAVASYNCHAYLCTNKCVSQILNKVLAIVGLVPLAPGAFKLRTRLRKAEEESWKRIMLVAYVSLLTNNLVTLVALQTIILPAHKFNSRVAPMQTWGPRGLCTLTSIVNCDLLDIQSSILVASICTHAAGEAADAVNGSRPSYCLRL